MRALRDTALAILGILFMGAVGLLLLSLFHCAHVFPTSCQPGAQLRDFDHRVMGVNDCYACDAGYPGRVNDAGHYLCRDYTCNECEAPVVPLGDRAPHADGGAR